MIFLQNQDPASPRAGHGEGKWICYPKPLPKIYFLKDGKLGNEKGDGIIKFTPNSAQEKQLAFVLEHPHGRQS